MRVVLLTGGGGAGVTTVAAATAALAAAGGMRTRLAGTDATAIEAILGRKADVPSRLTVVAPRPDAVFGADAPAVTRWLGALLDRFGLNADVTWELDLVPEIRSIAAMMSAVTDAEAWDLSVVDLGPASASLPLLHLLATNTRGDHDTAASRMTVAVVRPIVARLVDLPRPEQAVREAGRRAGDNLVRLRSTLHDTAAFSVRLVLPGDARRGRIERDARTVLGLNGIGLDAIIERGAGKTGDEGPDRPVRLAMPWTATPPTGAVGLLGLAEALYRGRSPGRLLAAADIPYAAIVDGGADFVVPVPEHPPDEFAVSRRGERLQVRVGDWQRLFLLPEPFRGLHGRCAWHDGRAFRVRFER